MIKITINNCLFVIRLKARNIMESCLSYIYPHTRVKSIVGILKTTAHNAYPVVTIDKAVSIIPEDDDYAGNPSSTNDEYARSKTMSFVVSEQRHRSQSMEDSGLHDRQQVNSAARMLPRQLGDLQEEYGSIQSASVPATSFIHHARSGFHEVEEEEQPNIAFSGK